MIRGGSAVARSMTPDPVPENPVSPRPAHPPQWEFSRAEPVLIISDIHANWEALVAVLDATEGQWRHCICLGDVVGYGANPVECSLWVRDHCEIIVRGNHDRVAAHPEGLQDFNWLARRAVEWTREQLPPGMLEWIAGLTPGPVDYQSCELVHGSVRDEDEYMLSLEQAADCLPLASSTLTFFGHTHVQGGYQQAASEVVALEGELSSEHDARTLVQYVDIQLRPDVRYLLNPGSVGQPRDGDWRAAFALWAGERLRLGRVPYNLPLTQRKILSAGLPAQLAQRLSAGQ